MSASVTLFTNNPTTGRGFAVIVPKERAISYFPALKDKIEFQDEVFFEVKPIKGMDGYKVAKVALKCIHSDDYADKEKSLLMKYLAAIHYLPVNAAFAEYRLREELKGSLAGSYLRQVLEAAVQGKSNQLTVAAFGHLAQKHSLYELRRLLELDPYLPNADYLIDLACRMKEQYERDVLKRPHEEDLLHVEQFINREIYNAAESVKAAFERSRRANDDLKKIEDEVASWKQSFIEISEELLYDHPVNELLCRLKAIELKLGKISSGLQSDLAYLVDFGVGKPLRLGAIDQIEELQRDINDAEHAVVRIQVDLPRAKDPIINGRTSEELRIDLRQGQKNFEEAFGAYRLEMQAMDRLQNARYVKIACANAARDSALKSRAPSEPFFDSLVDFELLPDLIIHNQGSSFALHFQGGDTLGPDRCRLLKELACALNISDLYLRENK